MNVKYAVLGGNGFIGRHLIAALRAEPQDVVCVGGFGAEGFGGVVGVPAIHGRITTSLLRSLPFKPDVVFHLAGGASVSRSVENPRHDFELTVNCAQELLEYLRTENPGAHLVCLSSAAVYGRGNGSPLSIHAERKPVSPYGLHKMLVEQLCEYYCSQGHLSRCSIVRPFSVYGPGLRKQLLWDAMLKIDAGDPRFFGSGKEMRDWVYVEDLVRVLQRIASRRDERAYDVFNAATGCGRSVEVLLTELFGAAHSTLRPVFLGVPREGDPDSLVAATENAYVGDPKIYRTPINEGLRRYVEWYRKAAAPC